LLFAYCIARRVVPEAVNRDPATISGRLLFGDFQFEELFNVIQPKDFKFR